MKIKFTQKQIELMQAIGFVSFFLIVGIVLFTGIIINGRKEEKRFLNVEQRIERLENEQ